MSKAKVENTIILILIFLVFSLAPLSSNFTGSNFETEEQTTTVTNPVVIYPSILDLNDEDKFWIDSVFNSLTLFQKCSQMVMPAVYRSFLNPNSPDYKKIKTLVKDYGVGGLIFFQGDLKSTYEMINRMQEISDVPLFVASDLERGLGMRIDDALGFPHNMALGSTFNYSFARQMGEAISKEGRVLGINLNFAPVADINNNANNPTINIRAFSENKFKVAGFVKEFIEGSKEGKMLSTAKHFPGHGDTEIDSHKELPLIRGSKEKLFDNEIYPFREAINSGVPAIMIGHLEVPALDPIKGTPSSLSEPIVSGILKKELGFEGLIITDAMNMSAVTKYYSVAEATVLSVKAGNDIVLMPPDEEIAINAIYDAVKDRGIEQKRIDESVRKILSFKRWLNIQKKKDEDFKKIESDLQNSKYYSLAKRIADNSITLLKNEANIIPLSVSEFDKITTITISDNRLSENDLYFSSVLEDRFGEIISLEIQKNSKNFEYNYAVETAEKSDLVIIAAHIKAKSYQGPVDLSSRHIDFIKKLLKLNKPVVLISFENPYLLSLFPEAKTYLNTFSTSQFSQRASLKALLGEIDIAGRLPVSIPKTGLTLGDGLKLAKSTDNKLTYGITELNKFESFNNTIRNLIRSKIIPGAVALVVKDEKIIYENAFGNDGFNTSSILFSDNKFALNDFTASLTVSIASMIARDEGKMSLNDIVYYHIEEFKSGNKNRITISELLNHRSGLPKKLKRFNGIEKEAFYRSINQTEIGTENRTQNISDLNWMMLQQLVENAVKKDLDNYINEKLFRPLNLTNTTFTIVSGEEVSAKLYESPIMTETLNTVDVYGFTGFSSSAKDLAKIASLFLQNGYYDGEQIIKAKTVKEWLSKSNPLQKFINGFPTENYFSWFDVSLTRNAVLLMDGNSFLITDRQNNLISIFLVPDSASGRISDDNFKSLVQSIYSASLQLPLP